MSIIPNLPRLRDQEVTRINAKELKSTEKATQFDCEGDIVWLAKSTFRDNKNGTIDIVDWVYIQKFQK